MTLQELRDEHSRLSHPENFQDAIDFIDIYSNFFLATTSSQKDDQVSTPEAIEANLVLQMMMTKALHLKNIIKGVSFTSKNDISLNNIVDPTIVGLLVRNTYETAGMFNLIFRVNKDGDERQIVYKLWVLSGLKYRQRFVNIITGEENRIKAETERQTIDKLIAEIHATELYNTLDDFNKTKIKNCIKQKDYLIFFESNTVKNLSWSELYKSMGIRPELFESLYTHFSFSAHPTNVAVFQFREMFLPESKKYIGMVLFGLQYFFVFSSIFIADYINLNPKKRELFNALPLIDQIVINFQNTFSRGYEYSINDSWKALG